jgi:DNA polymerase-3 subunit gamma/tau
MQSTQAYQVLARKYRPSCFDELIGQDALVRTLTNAIETNRVAHAFMLTGVRGVGKTTTARIIARAMNYTGADGTSPPTAGRTEDCRICQSIAAGHHPDVIEIDAASRTGIDGIREIIDGINYAPSEARYKIYIIDEIHMLSIQAFNALLKTLEEPPAHVKFIFATTEIRKVPVTILSRCQRFDLRRVPADILTNHFEWVAQKEDFSIEKDALSLIANAADGSVRDGLSLLDQAIAMSQGSVSSLDIQAMLGMSDRGLILDMIDHALAGRVEDSLEKLNELHAHGADPALIIEDLLNAIHLLTRKKAAPNLVNSTHMMTKEEESRLADMISRISMPSLNRAWKLLLNGLKDVQTSPAPYGAVEMAILQLIYAANLPDPATLMEQLKLERGAATGSGNFKAGSLSPHKEPQIHKIINNPTEHLRHIQHIISDHGQLVLAAEIYHNMRLIEINTKDHEITYSPTPNATQNLMRQLNDAFKPMTPKWVFKSIPNHIDAHPTLREQDDADQHALAEAIRNHPDIAEILNIFEGAQIIQSPN